VPFIKAARRNAKGILELIEREENINKDFT